jgi:cell division protein FtsW (lipid II flippase)
MRIGIQVSADLDPDSMHLLFFWASVVVGLFYKRFYVEVIIFLGLLVCLLFVFLFTGQSKKIVISSYQAGDVEPVPV